MGVDYGDFAGAYGGGYASRLRLVELPACAATTPDKSACRIAKPLATSNNTEKHTLTASSVPLRANGPTVLAAVGDDKSVKGDYKATSLSPSATWNTNLNTGDFTWSYDMPVPEVPGGLKPSVGLSYSSGSIDGRTGNSNNQGSWVGDGFELWPGYIERRYKPCSDDGEKHADGNKPGDLCWSYDNAFISFNGKAGELVPAGKDEWKLQNDDGTKIKRLTSAARGNGDNDNEYWELTDPSGTRFYFGYHKLPGWAAGKDTTDSTWTVPVFGNNSGEDCHKDAFKDSWCQQGWRWNLDYVVDPHGDAIAYYYDKETNSYGRDLNKDDDTPYIRGGSLKRIEYGRSSGDLYAGKPLAQVSFSNAERCLPQTGVTCAADTIDAKSFYWYDTPWDLNCTAGSTCDQGRFSPTFWTRKRLTGVTTEVLKDGALTPVDSWALNQRWGKADVDYQLELESIQHTGHTDTTPLTLPKTTFAYTQLANRLDKTGDGYAPYIKDRLSTVDDEYGGQTDVGYSEPACAFDDLPTPESNTTRCFPQFIGGSSSDDMDKAWFNKYVVTSVTTTDRTGGAPDQVTRYSYLGDAAWHYDDDDGLTKEKFKTWSQWRGYGHVRVQTGGQGTPADVMKTQEDSYFLRGMDGDRKTASGGTKDVAVALDEGEESRSPTTPPRPASPTGPPRTRGPAGRSSPRPSAGPGTTRRPRRSATGESSPRTSPARPAPAPGPRSTTAPARSGARPPPPPPSTPSPDASPRSATAATTPPPTTTAAPAPPTPPTPTRTSSPCPHRSRPSPPNAAAARTVPRTSSPTSAPPTTGVATAQRPPRATPPRLPTSRSTTAPRPPIWRPAPPTTATAARKRSPI